MIKIKSTKIHGVFKININKYKDKRGYFYEIYNRKNYNFKNDLSKFIQSNISMSKKNVLRGLHYQIKNPQSQLVSVISGKIFDVVVDLRANSKTFMKYDAFTISENSNTQIFMPPGVAHGFVSLSDKVIINYEVNKIYKKDNECGLIWNDKRINIKWPILKPIISKRDREYKNFDFLVRNNQLPKI